MFAGFCFQDSPPSADSLALPPRPFAAFPAPDRAGRFAAGGFQLWEQRRCNGPASRDERIPLVCPQTGAVLAFWGRLDNRETLLGKLREPAPAQATPTDVQLVLAAWRRWGEALPEHLLGDFALAVFEPAPRRLFLARDPLGVKPLYYTRQHGGLAFATSVSALRGLPRLTFTPDADWMARYLLGLSASDSQTGYREVLKLPPGHCLSTTAAGSETPRRWHAWRDDAPTATRREARWVDAYRTVLEDSIRCRMDSDYPLGTENSGGLDSATITAYLAELLGEPGDRLHSFGFALCEQEPAFILETSQAKRIVHNYLITARPSQADVREQRVVALRALGYPEEHGNGTYHTPFYRECARRGIRTLFSGFGGDEVVTNPGYHLRRELRDQGHYRALWDVLPGRPVGRCLRFGKHIALGKRTPAYNREFLAAWNTRWPHQLVREEVVARLDLHTEYLETARYDAPYRRVNDFILQQLLRMPYIATRLENCTLMAAAHGVDYRWPLWDVRLVQQYLSTPGIEKVGPNGMGRYLHRRAIQGIVPRRVAWKPSKDMGYGRLHQERNHERLAALANEARPLEAGLHPALDALVDRAKLRQQIRQVAEGRTDRGFSFGFLTGVRATQWLDQWLKDGRTE